MSWVKLVLAFVLWGVVRKVWKSLLGRLLRKQVCPGVLIQGEGTQYRTGRGEHLQKVLKLVTLSWGLGRGWQRVSWECFLPLGSEADAPQASKSGWSWPVNLRLPNSRHAPCLKRGDKRGQICFWGLMTAPRGPCLQNMRPLLRVPGWAITTSGPWPLLTPKVPPTPSLPRPMKGIPIAKDF